jgi:hypothetical protein
MELKMELEDENNTYNPEPPKYYKFKGKDILNDNYKKSLDNYKKVNIFAYEVRTTGTEPFMQILLSKSVINRDLIFPQSPLLTGINNKEELINYVKVCLFGMLNLEDFEVFDGLIDFDGFYESEFIEGFKTNNELYLFFEITRLKMQLDDIYLNSQFRFALIDELVNTKNICNIPIHLSVINLFSCQYDNFCHLIDENNNNYEIPTIAYTSKLYKKLNYHYVFGESKSGSDEIFGPYYYFNDFYKAFENAGNLEGQTGIVRYALFLGSLKYVENRPEDSIDMSETKVNKLTDPSGNPLYERLTMRITDYDGIWAKKYDSIYLGQVVLDNDQILNRQITSVKQYEQHIPLSYHYINKSTLNGDTNIYSIL